MSPRRFRVWLSLAAVFAGVAACEINPQPPLPLGGKGPETPGTGGTLGDGTTAGSSAGGGLVIDQGGTSTSAAGTASTGGSAPVDIPSNGGAGGESSAGGAGGDGQAGGAGGQDDGGEPPK